MKGLNKSFTNYIMTHADVPLNSLLDPKRVQLYQIMEVDGTWCHSQFPALKGGERGVLKAPGLD
jgi:hypothetical protein